MVKLSQRLSSVAQYVPKDSILADIGSDHAYLPCALVKDQNIKYAIAGEVAKGPFQRAQLEVQKQGLTSFIDVRLGDGLSVINPGQDQVTCITICGMGGKLIRRILHEGYEQQHIVGKERLILQPNVGELYVRRWLMKHNYMILEEQLLEEDGYLYEIIVAEPSSISMAYTAKDLLFGPYLLQHPDELFYQKRKQEQIHYQNILDQLPKRVETEQKRKQLEHILKHINEVIK